MRKIFGSILIILTILGSILYGSPLFLFIDVPTILGLLGMIIGAVVVRHTKKELFSLNQLVGKTIFNSAILSGFIIYLIGSIQLFQNMPNNSSIGFGMAIVSLSFFFAIIIALFSYILFTEKTDPTDSANPTLSEKNHIRSLIGFSILIASIFFAILHGSQLSIFIDKPSIIFIIGMLIGSIIVRHPWKDIARFNPEVSNTLIITCYLAGALGSLIGFIQTLQNMVNPSSFGPAMSICLLSSFYSIIISFFIYLFSRINSISPKFLLTGQFSVAAIQLMLICFLNSFTHKS
jgi:xanthosine utilization system XapX-like protein